MNYLEKKILERLNIEEYLKEEYHYYAVRRRGNEINGKCIFPDHNDKHPSFSINVETGEWNCYVCGGGKSIFSLIRRLEGLKNNNEAQTYLQKKLKIPDIDILEFSQDILNGFDEIQEKEEKKKEFHEIYLDWPYYKPAIDYYEITSKRVTKWMINNWNIKYAIDGFYRGRIIIPIEFDEKIVSFVARDLTGKSEKWKKISNLMRKKGMNERKINEKIKKIFCPKILYPEFSQIGKLIFNLDKAKKQKTVIITEGVFDCMKIESWGLNSIALLGCTLNRFKLKKIIENFEEVFICLDNDLKENCENPGQKSAKKIQQELKKYLSVKNILLPPSKDPDECEYSEFKKAYDNAEN